MDDLLRFVIDPDGQVVFDVDQRLPGRGLWLSAERDVVNTACTKGFFAKAARANITVPADLAERMEEALLRRCLDFLGLARRAGQAVAGFEKVRGWLREGRAGLLVEASDGSRDGRDKVKALAPGLPVVQVLCGSDLGRAMGRERTVHLALAPGRLAKEFERAAVRLKGVRGDREGSGAE